MSKEDILSQISGEDWIKKGGLDIPDDIFEALDSPYDWLDGLKPISFSRDNLPTIDNILSFFPQAELGDIVKTSSIEMLRTSYGINKCFNSKTHKDLAEKANQLLSKSKARKKDVGIYNAAVQANNLFLNLGLVKEQSESYSGQMGEVSIYDRIKQSEAKNKDWLLEVLEETQEILGNAAEDAIAKIKRLIRKLTKFMKVPRPYESNSISGQYISLSSNFSPSAIIPVAAPGVVDVVGVVNAIASELLKTFILKAVAIPAALAEGLVSTVTSIVLKGLGASGTEAVRYIAGGILRGAKDLLPSVFNNTGMFAGAWAFLTSCAPYILAAAIIIILAIKMSQKVQVGNLVTLLATTGNDQDPDLVSARISGDSAERLKDLADLKTSLLEETGKDYANIYGFTFEKGDRKLCVDMTLPVLIPIKGEIAATLWANFSARFDFLTS
ncbi:hypothetical protein [Cylindrospermum sp. FACHB-282]|uniref:hypothetical protein n=1 Tax=Cylindrospermum sp. FACHB-282 TaxID=2692794 RepID=UPI001685F70D|nr:hypothetical protein [Cylindrospermum sp. FACHB-282]MBD2386028.1 hypothetical protein [Cylindrospermum sp. FACHB-282]